MHYLDPIHIIQTVGLIGIFIVVFMESGVFFGFFLPGDSLLFTAGLFAHAGLLPFFPLMIGCAIAAILGDTVGYMTGLHIGPRLFVKEGSLFFKKKHLHEAEYFYKKHGTRTIFFARFIPIIRTFAPIVAGVGKMHYRTFISYNIIGGIVWAFLMPTIGYYVGSFFPDAQKYLLPITIGVVVLSLLPLIKKMIKRYF